MPELARRMTVSSCRHDPVPAFTPVLTAMPAAGIPLGDVLADSGYSHRVPQHWASPLRAAGAQLVQDLHPRDRGPKGTRQGAVIANGSLYCPSTPRTLLELGPLRPRRHPGAGRAHDAKAAEAARYKLGRLTSDDADGYHRVACPAAAGKVRCPLRPAVDEPGPGPPGDPQPRRSTPRPAAPSRRSPSRRTCWPRPRRSTTTRPRPGAAPTPAAAAPSAAFPPPRTPPATTSPAAGAASWAWPRSRCSPHALLVARNQRILAAWNARQEENARRAARGPPPENPQAPPQDPHRDRIRRPALTGRRAPSPPARTPAPRQRQHARIQENKPGNSKKGASGALSGQPGSGRTTTPPETRPKREHRPH